MWHEDEIIKIFKSYIEKNSYESFKDKKLSSNLCNDLLYEYENECRILCILFREGLGELLPETLLNNESSINIFAEKTKKFIRKIGFDNQVILAVVNILQELFCKKEINFYTAENILKMQIKKDEEYKKIISKRLQIERIDDWKQIENEKKTEIVISSLYREKEIPFKLLKNVKKLACYVPMSYMSYKQLDMSQIEELYCSIIDENKNIVINAPCLKKLSIYINNNIYERITPLERILQFENKIIDLSKLDKLEELKILHSSGYSVVTQGKLKKLKKIIQTNEQENEFEWLAEIPFLEEYENYNGNMDDINYLPKLENINILKIENNKLKTIDNIKRYPKLKKLSVRGNEIDSINIEDMPNNLKYLDLRKNAIITKLWEKTFDIPNVFLTELDYKIASLEDEFNDLFYTAYKDIKINEGVLKRKTELEKFIIFANDNFKQKLSATKICGDELGTEKLKNAYVQYAREHYDFLNIN